MADLWATGVSPEGHPTRFVRERSTGSAWSPPPAWPGRRRRRSGCWSAAWSPTASGRRPPQGITFINLEDETGLINVVCSKGCWARHRRVARTRGGAAGAGPAGAGRGGDQRGGRAARAPAPRWPPPGPATSADSRLAPRRRHAVVRWVPPRQPCDPGVMVRRRLVVSGAVQGVWFRDSCRQEATRLGLTGWVGTGPMDESRSRSKGSGEPSTRSKSGPTTGRRSPRSCGSWPMTSIRNGREASRSGSERRSRRCP